jgi:hypothetical protein
MTSSKLQNFEFEWCEWATLGSLLIASAERGKTLALPKTAQKWICVLPPPVTPKFGANTALNLMATIPTQILIHEV